MISVISPAKTLDFSMPVALKTHTQPVFLAEAKQLVSILRSFKPEQLVRLMDLSPELAELNAERYKTWQLPFTAANAKQALLAFKGDVYLGLAAEDFTTKDFAYAQQHLCILSGLYGILRPLDLMQAYRLEMGTALANKQGKNLYHFWGDKITAYLNQAFSAHKTKVLVNLASEEYFKALRSQSLTAAVITPVFKDYKNGQYKVISFLAKKARGLMSRFIVQQRLDQIQALKDFNLEGYSYNAKMSSTEQLVFTRKLKP